jgi:hypothetical protein
MLAVLASLKLIKGAVREWSEALSAPRKGLFVKYVIQFVKIGDLHKALRVPEFTVGVDNLLMRLEFFIAARAKHGSQG